MKKSAMTAVGVPPPPPQPPSKRSRKTLIAVILIVAIVVVAVGVYLATRGGAGGPSPSVTPTPTSSAAVSPTPTSSGGGANVAGASSLQFTVDVTGGSSQGTYKYMAKNVGTSSMMIRVEMTTSSGNFVEIINGAQQKAWIYQNGAWTDLSSTFSDQWSSWSSTWTGYKNNLADWTGSGDWTYTASDGSTIRIHNISVNPSLADSLFQPS
jgi:hypothetical protein